MFHRSTPCLGGAELECGLALGEIQLHGSSKAFQILAGRENLGETLEEGSQPMRSCWLSHAEGNSRSRQMAARSPESAKKVPHELH